ncbi:hypothetical protein VTN77DRAFT_2950 [Rasamsonia byssochlamydoides]|uniref:uncharacterized protein n=1 Tax=Rasamsonia byssochlamydoides TaxID=89139 RepID=UPI0037427D94
MESAVYYPSAQAIAIPILSLLAIILSIPPLVWHSANRNFPASSLIGWFLVNDVFNVANALIWPTDDVDSWWSGAGLCDVEVKLMIASYIGLPGALLCIFRSLAEVMDSDRATLVPSRAQRLRKRAVEIFFCLGLPVLAMIAHYPVQPNRYILLTISGCMSTFDNSWPGIVLSYFWPPVVCLLAGWYGVLVLIRLVKYRTQFSAILSSAGSSVSGPKFLRLFILSFIMILAILPLQSYVFYVNVVTSLPLQPYSWSRVHGPDWNTIPRIPTHGTVSFDRWIPIGGSISLFLFFGFGHDATAVYRSLLLKMGLGRLFPSLAKPRVPTGGSGSRYGGLVSKVSDRVKTMFGRASWRFSKIRLNSVSTEVFASSSVGVEKDLPLPSVHRHYCHCGRMSAGDECPPPPPLEGIITVTQEIRQASESKV